MLQVFSLFLLLPSLIAAKCPLNWHQFDNQCYFYSPMVTTFFATEQICQVRGGHLASIHSEDQNDFIVNQVINGGILNFSWAYAYIGGYLIYPSKQWLWNDATPVNYTNFAPRNVVPAVAADDDGSVSAIRIRPDGYWISMLAETDDYAEGFICQVPTCDSNGKSAKSILSQNMTNVTLAYLSNANSWLYGCPGCFARTYLSPVAETQCQTFEAHLPSVTSAFQNSELANAYNSENSLIR